MNEIPLWEWVVLALCTGSTAFFSAAETSLTALSEAKTRQLVEQGSNPFLKVWLNYPERVLSTLLIGATGVSIGASALASQIMATLGVPHGVAIAAAVMTFVVLVFGEVIPKNFAKRHAPRVASLLLPFVYVLVVLLYPFSAILVGLTRGVMGWLNPGSTTNGPSTTEQEIEYLIGLGTREGVLDEVKEELLNSVLEFADRLVKEIMVPRTKVVALDRASSYDETLRTISDSEHSRLPVYTESIDNILGVANIKDILKDVRKGLTPEAFKLDAYARPPLFVPELMKISRLLKEFQKRKTHLAVVVDEFGGTSGIVTLEDVVEEIVGEIQDEHDVEEKPIKQIGPQKFLADASLNVRQLEEVLGVTFPEEGDYETLGGFLTATAGKVPSVGSLVAWNGIGCIVRAGDDRRVLKVEIHGKAPPGSPPGPAETKSNTGPS